MRSTQCIAKLVCVIIFILNISISHSQRKYNNDASVIKDPTGYKLRVGDKIKITVRGEAETNVDAIINNEGKASARYLGELKISGLNTKQAEQLVTQEYRKQLIFKNPVVNIYISKYSDRVVFLSGSVNRKGPYNFPPEVEAMNIVEVIARAGGFTDIARKSRVYVTRTFYDDSGEVKDTKTSLVSISIRGAISGNSSVETEDKI